MNKITLFVFFEIDFRQIEGVFGRLDVAFILTLLNAVLLVRGNPVGFGLVHFDFLILELLHESRRIEFHEFVTFDDLNSRIDDPLDGGCNRTALGAGPNGANNIAVLGGFQRAHLRINFRSHDEAGELPCEQINGDQPHRNQQYGGNETHEDVSDN